MKDEADKHILASKLRPPRLRHVLNRSRLLRMVDLNRRMRVANICAGPGYGKTTLMAQMAQNFDGSSIWYQVDSLDRDPAIFLQHFIAGISNSCGYEAARSWSRLSEATDISRDGENIMAVIIDELKQNATMPVLICCDDFHLFSPTDHTPKLIDYLLGNMPANINVAIASRTNPTLKMSRFRSQGKLCDVGESDLQFSMDEMSGLMEAWEIDASDVAVQQVHKSTEGWAAGLVLTESFLREGHQAPDLFTRQRMQKNVYEYLAEEVLHKQPVKIQDFLMQAALVDPIEPAVCQSALGSKGAAKMLAKAEQANLFTTSLDDADSYRFHPLFREFLLSRLQLDSGADGINDLRLKYAKAFISKGREKNAVEQYLEAGHQKETVALIEKLGDEMLGNAENETLERWIDLLDKNHLTPSLNIYRALMLISMRNYQKALAILKNTEKDIIPDDGELFIKIQLALADCLSSLGQSKKGVEILVPILDQKLEPGTRLNVINRLAACFCGTFDVEGIRACMDMAHECSSIDTVPLIKECNFILVSQNLCQGNFNKAYELLSIHLSDADLTESQKNIRMNNLASCLMLLGKYSEAKVVAEECVIRVENQREYKLLPLALDTLGCTSFALTDYDDGEMLINKALSNITKYDFTNSEDCPEIYCHLGTFARRRGRFGEAVNLHNKCLTNASFRGELYDVAISAANIAADLIRLTHFEEAEKYFRQARALANKHNFRYVHTSIDFTRAWKSHLLDDNKNEYKYISSSLKRAEIYQHNHWVIQEGKISLPLFTFALSNKIETDYVLGIMAIIGEESLSAIEPVIEHKDSVMREKIAKYLYDDGSTGALTLLRRMRYDSDREVKNMVQKYLTSLRGSIASSNELLTLRETEVLKLISHGLSNGAIANKLYISERTVKTHVAKIFRKLGFTSRLDAALFYKEKNTTFEYQRYNQ